MADALTADELAMIEARVKAGLWCEFDMSDVRRLLATVEADKARIAELEAELARAREMYAKVVQSPYADVDMERYDDYVKAGDETTQDGVRRLLATVEADKARIAELEAVNEAYEMMLGKIAHKAKLVNFGNVSTSHRPAHQGVEPVLIMDTIIEYGGDPDELDKDYMQAGEPCQ